jgi:parallel beta-helix repeat protein
MYNSEAMIVSGSNTTVIDNVCVYNTRQGMRVAGNDGVKVINNNCSYNGGSPGSGHGISVDGENALIANNTCNGNGGDGTSAGIYFDEVDTATVYNNTCNYNTWTGIRVYRGSPTLIITNNTVVGNRWGIRIEGYYSGPVTFDNEIGWNWEYNALDDVYEGCQWDNGVNLGNYWGDYNGTYPTYPILGSAGSVDNYPFKADTTTPVITFLDDFNYEAGSTGNYVNWTPSDDHPDVYQIFRDETPIESGAWDGSNISISIDGLDLGVYNFTLLVWDTCANSASRTVFVTVEDTTPPTLNHPADVTYNEGQINNTIIWTPSDLYPAEYQILKDSSLLKNGDWNSTGESIIVTLDGLMLGEYNYTLIVIDIENNTNSDTVMVNVLDGTSPIINHPEDIEYDEGEIGNLILWDPEDSYPVTYQILQDGSVIKSGPWNSTIETISISVDGLGPGEYNYTLVVYDVGGNTGTDTVIVVVNDIIVPTINHPSDIEMELGSLGYQIIWSPSDLYLHSWELYLDNVLINFGPWNSSLEAFEVSLDGLDLGEYNYTLVVYDISGNSVSDAVMIDVVDTTNPSLDNPDDITYECGSTGNNIAWSSMDLKPDSYEVYRNGTLVDSGNWSGSIIQISIDGLALGHYSYNIVVFDTSGNTASDSVEITVVDTTDPTLSSPDDVQFKEGDSGYNLTWILIDVNPQSYEIFMDLTLIASGLWNSTGETITISLDDLLEGVHHLTIYVSDLAGNEASDMIIVTVLPSTPDGPSGDSALQPIIILGIGLGCGVVISVIVVFIFKKKMN